MYFSEHNYGPKHMVLHFRKLVCFHSQYPRCTANNFLIFLDVQNVTGFFFFFKLWKYNTFTGDLENTEQSSIRVRACCCLWLFVTLGTITWQTPLSMRFSRQEYWSELLFPSLGDLPKPGIKPVSTVSPALQTYSLPLSHQGSPIKHTVLTMFNCTVLCH